MEQYITVTSVLGVLIAVAGWLMKRTIDAQETKLSHLEDVVDTIKQEYLHKNDFRDFKAELRGMFEEIQRDIRSLREKGH